MSSAATTPTVAPASPESYDFSGHVAFWIAGGAILVGVLLALLALRLASCIQQCCSRPSRETKLAKGRGRDHTSIRTNQLEELVLPDEYEEEVAADMPKGDAPPSDWSDESTEGRGMSGVDPNVDSSGGAVGVGPWISRFDPWAPERDGPNAGSDSGL
jgi:hypothetical protein